MQASFRPRAHLDGHSDRAAGSRRLGTDGTDDDTGPSRTETPKVNLPLVKGRHGQDDPDGHKRRGQHCGDLDDRPSVPIPTHHFLWSRRSKISRVRCNGPMRHFVTKLHGAEFKKAGCRETSLGGIAQRVTPIYIAKSLVCARSTNPPLPSCSNCLPWLHGRSLIFLINLLHLG